MSIIYVPVTHESKHIMLETNAPTSIIDVAFLTTNTPDELIDRLQSVGYYAGETQYTMKLNYDQK